jgi:hypothetical protein
MMQRSGLWEGAVAGIPFRESAFGRVIEKALAMLIRPQDLSKVCLARAIDRCGKRARSNRSRLRMKSGRSPSRIKLD